MFLRIAAILNEVLSYIRRFLFYIACRLIALGVSDLSPDRSLDIALFDHLPKDLTQRGRHQQIRIVDVLQSKAMDRVFVHFYASEGGVIAGAISLMFAQSPIEDSVLFIAMVACVFPCIAGCGAVMA